MRKATKKISLHRETLRTLAGDDLQEAIGGAAGGAFTGVSQCIVCRATANTCITHCGCPTMVQNCTALC